jgi:hypothetical protein
VKKYYFLLISIVLVISACGKDGKFLGSLIIKNEVNKLELRHSGNGALYSTSDKELINEFYSYISSVTYSKVTGVTSTGGSTLKVFSSNEKEVAQIIVLDPHFLIVNEVTYKADKIVDMKAFYDKFISEKYLTKG